jgi:hypothetical protein
VITQRFSGVHRDGVKQLELHELSPNARRHGLEPTLKPRLRRLAVSARGDELFDLAAEFVRLRFIRESSQPTDRFAVVW